MDAKNLIEKMTQLGWKIVTVESCTGGALASAITDEHGASNILEKAFVTYSNQAKVSLAFLALRGQQMANAIKECTVYSPEVALEMALIGGLHAKADVSVGITGALSREDPANPGSQVGDVYIAIQVTGQVPFSTKLTVPGGLTKKEAKGYVVEFVLTELKRMLGG